MRSWILVPLALLAANAAQAQQPTAADAAKPPALSVAEPKAPAKAKPAARKRAAKANAKASAVAKASMTANPPPPVVARAETLKPNGPCVIKPVMSDQDLVNCGATPRH